MLFSTRSAARTCFAAKQPLCQGCSLPALVFIKTRRCLAQGRGSEGAKREVGAVVRSRLFFVGHSYLQAQRGSRGQWGTRCRGSVQGFQAVASCQVQTSHFGGQPGPCPFQTPTPKPNTSLLPFHSGRVRGFIPFLPTSSVRSYQILTDFIPPVQFSISPPLFCYSELGGNWEGGRKARPSPQGASGQAGAQLVGAGSGFVFPQAQDKVTVPAGTCHARGAVMEAGTPGAAPGTSAAAQRGRPWHH